MKRQFFYSFIVFVVLMFTGLTVHAGEVVHIGTADKDVIVVTIETAFGEDIPTQVENSWTVNDVYPSEVGRYTYVWYQEIEKSIMSHRHHIYLKMPFALSSGTSYTIKTPAYGTDTLLFNDEVTLCESVHANQVGYFGGAKARYANFGIFMGDLGTRLLTEIPDYKVLNEAGETVKEGTLTYWGDDTGMEYETGEYVYRMDLAGLPNGGPYTISVEGYGCSYPFGVGPDYINQVSYINIRGLFHQRCGIVLEEPYTEFTRGVCHDIVEITETTPPESGDGLITTRGDEMPIAGGYHDAADYDRRDSHPLIPSWMLAIYEAYPDGFKDNQYNMPESGNGIPDWLDECLWGLKVWEYLQESDGAIRGGTETSAYPPYGGTADTDILIYKTYKRYGVTTARGAGLFAYASRMVEPFDATRAAELLQRAVDAWDYLQANSMPTAYDAPMMYAALQLYMATESQTYHDAFKVYANHLLTEGTSEEAYRGGSLGYRSTIFGPYFFSYLLTDLPTDQDIIDGFTQIVSDVSDKWLGRLESLPYPIVTIPNYGWGRASAQGIFAEPLIYMYRITGDSTYLEGVSEMANYTLGQNPLNRTYITGLGAKSPSGTRNHDTYHFFKEGKGTIPGITVYGLINEPASSRTRISQEVYPDWFSLGQQRRYSDGWEFLRANEYTVTETISQNTCMYGFLSAVEGGGTIIRPDAPTALIATAVSPSEIDLSWSHAAGDAEFFKIERRTGENYSEIAIVPASENSYNDVGLASTSTDYSYHVRAYNKGGHSLFTEGGTATTFAAPSPPAAPSELLATTISSSQIELTWTDNSDDETGFKVERKTGVAGSYSPVVTLGGGVKNYTNVELSEFTTYYYRVVSYNDAGNSELSNEASATTEQVSTELLITIDGSQQVFDQMSTYGENQDYTGGYEFQNSGTAVYLHGNAWKKVDLSYTLAAGSVLEFDFRSSIEGEVHAIGMDDNITEEDVKTFMIHGIQDWGVLDFNDYTGTDWKHYSIPIGSYYTGSMDCLFFANDGDDEEGSSYYKNIEINTSGGTLPTAPGDLAASADLSSEISISWTDNSDNESGFKIERKTGAEGTYEEIAIVGADITSYKNTTLTSGITYFYQVRAYNGAGNSAYASEASATTPVASLPIAPDALEARAVSNDQINLTWTDNSDDEDYFKVERKVGADGTFVEIATLDANVTGYSSTGLAKSTVYTFRVRAYNGAGDSEYSNSAFATTLGTLVDGHNADNFTWGLWHMDESAGEIVVCDPAVSDAETKNINLTGGYTRAVSPGWMPAPDGHSLNFGGIDGTGQCDTDWYIDYSSAGGGVSMEAWVKPNSEYTGILTIISARYGGSRSVELRLSYGRIHIRVGSVTTPYDYGKLPVGVWTHLAAVVVPGPDDESFTDDHAYLYINGQLEGETPELTSAWESGTAPLKINESGLFDGQIDEVRISNIDRYHNFQGIVEIIPEAPTGLTATVVSSSSVGLSWTDNSEGEAGFVIERKSDSEDSYAEVGRVSTDVTSYEDSGLDSYTGYTYIVYAYNGLGDSEISNEAVATTLLATPASLNATAVSESQIDLSWTYSSGDEDGFRIERKTGEDGTYTQVKEVTAKSYSDTELDDNTTYYYRVFAFNSAVVSDYSDEASAMTVGIEKHINMDDLVIEAYPNPFSRSTQIVYTLSETANVDIVIYDITGRKILHLLNDVQEADSYAVKWNSKNDAGSTVKEGLYICKLVLSGQSKSCSKILRLVVIN